VPAFNLRSRSPDGAATDCGEWWQHLVTANYSFIDPKRMKGWVGLVGLPSGRFTHKSGHPSVVGRAHDRESSLVKDWRSTAAPRTQNAYKMHFNIFIKPVQC